MARELAYGWRYDFNRQAYLGPQGQAVPDQRLAEIDPFAAELFRDALRPKETRHD